MEVEIEIPGGMYEVLDDTLPDGVDPVDWLGLQAEQAISQARLQARQEDIQRSAQAGGVPQEALLSNDDVSPPTDGGGDRNARDTATERDAPADDD